MASAGPEQMTACGELRETLETLEESLKLTSGIQEQFGILEPITVGPSDAKSKPVAPPSIEALLGDVRGKAHEIARRLNMICNRLGS